MTLNLLAEQPGWVRPVGILAYHAATVTLGAAGDACYLNGNKDLGHVMHAMEIGALVGGPFLFKVTLKESPWYIGSYIGTRFLLFDYAHNVFADLPVGYLGTTSFYDRTLSKVPPDGVAFYKCWAFVLTAHFTIKYMK